jgi:hypothetical protein
MMKHHQNENNFKSSGYGSTLYILMWKAHKYKIQPFQWKLPRKPQTNYTPPVKCGMPNNLLLKEY